jgi:DNA polymerase-3 subunit alpha
MHLNSHSYYSLRYGTISIEDLVEEAATAYGTASGSQNQVFGDVAPAMALTDINNSTGIMDFVAVCKDKHIKPIAGIEFRTGDQLKYTGLAKNNEGFRELNEFLSDHNLRNLPFPDRAPDFEHVFIIYPLSNGERRSFSPSRRFTAALPQEMIGIRPSGLNPLMLSRHRDLVPRMVLMAPVTFRNAKEYELHRNFRAVDHNVLLSRLEPHQVAAPDEMMMRMDELQEMVRDFPEIISNTIKLTEACSIDFDFKSCKNRKTFTGSRYDDLILLEKLAFDGLQYRYHKGHAEATRRVRHELDIIDRMGFSAYFLIAWDIIRYSMSRGFYHVGRGSGANSIVAYCLRITDVDPIELDLYFERFINPKRTSPPDFDIDYSWKERDEVLDYIFKRYGHAHTALLGAMSTFRDKSIYRELGKVHGLPKGEIDAFLRNPGEAINRNHIIAKIHDLGEMMADFPNLRSIHAGGVLISEEPITCYTALDLPPKGFPTTQWDMYIAEEIGFEKLDILSQRGIGHIYETAEIVKQNLGISVDVHNIKAFKEDKKVKEQLRSARTIGCFYVESPAMRGLLKKLQCDNYRTLVAASSIIRPGVARSGMMKEYIFRFHNPGRFKYLHPVMEDQLKETYGVMVYQEDVLKICHHFAGLDLADADVIRRAMSGKYRSKKELQRIIDKFFDNCRQSGYPEEVTKEVWRQIESFAGYSFSKAHSASYAVESYQSLYLKAHYPLEFITGVINNFGGFYSSWVYFNEARVSGASLHPPCVNRSEYKTCIRGKDIYLGFIHVANLEATVGKAVCEGRTVVADGITSDHPYQDLEDFIGRVPIVLEQLIILIRVGAFRFTGKQKANLLWEAHMLTGKKQPTTGVSVTVPVQHFELPQLEHNALGDVYDEIELLGFPVTHSYFDLLETKFRGDILAHEMAASVGKTVRMLGLLVTIKYVRTVKKEWMHFGTFIDVNGRFFDTVHFPKTVNQYPFRGDGIYLVKGKIVEEFGFPSMNVEKMAKMPFLNAGQG